jgi:hypothetical protein
MAFSCCGSARSFLGVEGFCFENPLVVVLMLRLCRFLMAEKRVSMVLILTSLFRAISPALTCLVPPCQTLSLIISPFKKFETGVQ